MHIVPIYAALLALVFFYLSIRTIRVRHRLKIGVGAQDNSEMLRAMRVHANFAEYTPFALLLIYFVETSGGAPALVHSLGLGLLLGRVIHAYGVSQAKENFVYRQTGMVLTFSILLVCAAYLLLHRLMA